VHEPALLAKVLVPTFQHTIALVLVKETTVMASTSFAPVAKSNSVPFVKAAPELVYVTTLQLPLSLAASAQHNSTLVFDRRAIASCVAVTVLIGASVESSTFALPLLKPIALHVALLLSELSL
jgi:hypothetical protein